MKPGALKTTMWYKCLVCHSCFQSPKALVVHRMKSQCRFKYKEIHKERLRRPFETLRLENLKEEEASHFKDSQKLLKSQKATTLDRTEQYFELNEFKPNVPELSENSNNLNLPTRNEEQLKYNCYFCSSIFTNFEDLKKHMMSHTREESDENKPGSFNFDNCNKHGMKSVVLKLHKISASSKFICSLCQKSYSSKQSLNLHISVVHEKITPYSCKQCSKTFGQYINLKTHISTVHQGLKPYSCKQCSKSFSQSINLKTHVSTVHERFRLIACKQCPNKFITKRDLERHNSAVHQGIKPYSCKQCPKSFSQSVNLKTHIATVHERLRPYSCQQCPQSFGLLGNLKVHVSRVHKHVDEV